MNDDNVTKRAAEKCFAKSTYTPKSIDIAEVHDSTAFCELKALLELGLAKSDSIKTDVLTGKFLATGELPVNVSGGLIAKGHPLGATGIVWLSSYRNNYVGIVGPTSQFKSQSRSFSSCGWNDRLDEAVSVVGILFPVGNSDGVRFMYCRKRHQALVLPMKLRCEDIAFAC